MTVFVNRWQEGVRRPLERPQAALVLVTLAMLLSVSACAAQRTPPPVGVAERLEDDLGVPNLSRDGDVYFGGQPTEAGMRRLAQDAGVRTVISLRTEASMREDLHDEAALARSLGMRHVTMPLYAGGLDAHDIDRFAQVLESAEGPVLVHCRVSNSAGGVWAAYLALHRGYAPEQALERGRAAGLAKPETIETVRALIGAPPEPPE